MADNINMIKYHKELIPISIVVILGIILNIYYSSQFISLVVYSYLITCIIILLCQYNKLYRFFSSFEDI